MRLTRRVTRLEGPLPGGCLPLWARAIVREVAAAHGLDPQAVLREATAILVEAEAAGVLGSPEAVAAFLGLEAPDSEPMHTGRVPDGAVVRRHGA